MDRFLHLNLPAWQRKGPGSLLACAWLLGLVSGAVLSIFAGDPLFSMMRAAASSCVSIPGLLSATLLPLLFSAFAVYISKPWLLIPIAFGKAFLFSYLSVGVMIAFGSAGWLIWWLLMFSDSCSLPLLWWFWLKAVSQPRGSLIRRTGFALAAAAVIGSVDYCIVSPFLADLIL